MVAESEVGRDECGTGGGLPVSPTWPDAPNYHRTAYFGTAVQPSTMLDTPVLFIYRRPVLKRLDPSSLQYSTTSY